MVLVGLVFVVEELVDTLFLPDEEERSGNLWLLGFLYYVAKIGFFFWAGDATYRGATLVYEKGVSPAFNQLEAMVEGKKN